MNAKGYFHLAGFFRMNNKYDDAIKNYTEAIKLDHEYLYAYLGRADIYCWKGLYCPAIKDYTKVIELLSTPKLEIKLRSEPAFLSNIHFQRGIAYVNCKENHSNAHNKKDKYDYAIEDYTKAIELGPTSGEAYSKRAFAYNQKGEYDQAIADCREAIKLKHGIAEKHDNEIYDNLCFAYDKKGKHKDAFDALNALNEAIEQNPNLKFISPLIYIAAQIPEVFGVEKTTLTFKVYYKLYMAVHEIQNDLFCAEKLELAHYTSLHVFKAISKEECFRLYNAKYMNDPEEGQVFFKIIEEIIKKDEEDKKTKKEDWKIEDRFYKDQEQSYRSPAYIGSFVRDKEDTQGRNEEYKDELFLWRTYGKHDNEEAAGACLIFNKKCFVENRKHQIGAMNELLSYSSDGHIQEFLALYKIYYRDQDNNNDLKNKLKEVASQLKNIHEIINKEEEKTKNTLKRLVCELLDSIRFLFKERHYREENEVRVIQLRYGEENKSAESVIKVDMDTIPPRFYCEAPDNFRFNEVILGPRAAHFQEWKQWLTEQNKEQNRNIRIERSQIKYGKS